MGHKEKECLRGYIKNEIRAIKEEEYEGTKKRNSMGKGRERVKNKGGKRKRI